MNEYKFLKNQIISKKTDKNELLKIATILYAYKRYNDSFFMKTQQIDNLLDLLKSYLSMHENNENKNDIKFKKYFYHEPKYLYLVEPIENKYLLSILEQIDFNINNDYIVGLKNLLYDENQIYNTIGLKVIISKFLLSLKSLKDLKILKVNNDNLNDSFSFLCYKNNKIKFYSKLYFNNEYQLIIFNTLLHDDIKSVILFDENQHDINDIENIIYDYSKTKITDFNHIEDIKKYQYVYKNKTDSLFNMTQYLYYICKRILNKYEYINYKSIEVNNDNIYSYIRFFNKHYNDIIQTSNKLLGLYENIIQILTDIEDFKSNDLNKTSIKREQNEDYFKYKIDLKDYFLNP